GPMLAGADGGGYRSKRTSSIQMSNWACGQIMMLTSLLLLSTGTCGMPKPYCTRSSNLITWRVQLRVSGMRSFWGIAQESSHTPPGALQILPPGTVSTVVTPIGVSTGGNAVGPA